MALNIKNRDYVDTARELARITGKTIVESGLEGLKRELERQKAVKRILQKIDGDDPLAKVREIQKRYAAIPSKSNLSDDEVLGFDEPGVPTR